MYDVVDVDHQPGKVDALFRPNHILAVGGLPISLIDGEQAKKILSAVAQRLLAPLGLRSLAPGEPGYTARYEEAFESATAIKERSGRGLSDLSSRHGCVFTGER